MTASNDVFDSQVQFPEKQEVIDLAATGSVMAIVNTAENVLGKLGHYVVFHLKNGKVQIFDSKSQDAGHFERHKEVAEHGARMFLTMASSAVLSLPAI